MCLPPLGPRGEKHSLGRDGVGGPNSGEGTDTLLLHGTLCILYCNPSTLLKYKQDRLTKWSKLLHVMKKLKWVKGRENQKTKISYKAWTLIAPFAGADRRESQKIIKKRPCGFWEARMRLYLLVHVQVDKWLKGDTLETVSVAVNSCHSWSPHIMGVIVLYSTWEN